MEIDNPKKEIKPTQINTQKIITKNSYSDLVFENSFFVFKSINNLFILTYATEERSIIIYNLEVFQIITEIKEAHKDYITNFNHIYDNNAKMDLLMSVSRSNNNLKIWSLKNFNCILTIESINKGGILNSACFLNYQNNIYIVTSNRNWLEPDPIKIYNFKDIISGLKDSRNNTFFIDIYYDKNNKKTYIVSGNEGNIISYNFEERDKYKVYCEEFENNVFHQSFKIYESNYRTKLIESCDGFSGIIRIWEFHSAQLLEKIKASDGKLRCIYLWDKDNIFVGCGDKTIKLINLETHRIINSLNGHKNNVCSFKIIFHPKYGKCIISQGLNDDQIRIWISEE